MKFTCDSCKQTIKTTADEHHLSVGICGHSGATYETLIALLCDSNPYGDSPWRIAMYLHDGSVVEGEANYAYDVENAGDCITLLDDKQLVGTFDLADVKHIQIL